LLAVILASQTGIRWNILLEEAQEFNLELLLKRGLLELSELCPDVVQGDAVSKLNEIEPQFKRPD